MDGVRPPAARQHRDGLRRERHPRAARQDRQVLQEPLGRPPEPHRGDERRLPGHLRHPGQEEPEHGGEDQLDPESIDVDEDVPKYIYYNLQSKLVIFVPMEVALFL